MKFKIIFLIGAFVTLNLAARAQTQSFEALKIGDKIPDFTFGNLQNNKGHSQKASELYKSGLLIINFWATWCVPCVRELPFLDSIQLQNMSYYNMVCVTDQSKATLSAYLEKHRDLKNLKFLAEDKKLAQYFPHHTIPHNVWIDKNGIVKAITGDEYISDKSIKAFLKGQTKMPVKQEDLTFDWAKPLVVADTEFLYRSIITPSKNIGDAGVILPDSSMYRTRFLAWNRTKTDLIWSAEMRSVMSKRDWKYVELHVKDSLGFVYPAFTNIPGWQRIYLPDLKIWSKKYQYCYELAFAKKTNIDTFYSLMHQELSSYFKVKVEIKIKETDCWAIKEIPGKLNDTNFTEKAQKQKLHFEGNVMIAKNQTISEIAKVLSSDFFSMDFPFIDKTSGKKSLSINKDFKDLSSGLTIERLKECLNEIGFDLNLEKCPYPFLVIYDKE